MNSLKLNYEFYEEKQMKEELLKFQKEGDLFHTESTMGHISINFDSILLNPIWKDGRYIKDEEIKNKVVITDWIWDWAIFFASEVPKLQIRSIQFTSSDNPLEINISKNNDKVILVFSGMLKGEVRTAYKNFIIEVHAFVDSFVQDLLKINPKLINHEQFKKIVEGRDKIKKLLDGIERQK